jgi:endonuclease YncB( thermonuclease family)
VTTRSKRNTRARQQTPQEPHTDAQMKRQLAQVLGKIIAVVLVLLLIVLIERYCSYTPPAFVPKAAVVSMDGDTIKAGDGSEYRIYGIDAPELHQTCLEANGKTWLCGRASKARLTTLLKRGKLNCEVRANDKFQRAIAVCSAEGVPDIGEQLVRDGYAIDFGPGNSAGPYRDAQDEAEAAKRGIWRGTFDRPSDWRQENPRLD